MFDLSYFGGKSHFEDDGTQNYLVFQPICRYFKMIGNTKHISAWKSKGLSDESIKPPAASSDSLAPLLSYIGVRPRVKFDGQFLKQNKVTFTHGKIVNIYIVFEINFWAFAQGGDFALENSLFGAVKLTKNAGFDKYKYSGYGAGFDARGSFSLSNGTDY